MPRREQVIKRGYVTLKKLALLDAVSTAVFFGVIRIQLKLRITRPRRHIVNESKLIIGAKNYPWGMLLLTVVYSDLMMPTLTLKKRPVKKIENHVRRFPPISTVDKINSHFSLFSESRAFSRSIYIILIFDDFSSSINVKSFKHFNKFVAVDLLVKKNML